MNLEAELNLAKAAGRRASKRLRRRETSDLAVDSAAGRDIKLAADREVEAIILEELQRSPHPVLAEESGDGGIDRERPYWVVDPLDGTFNYHRGIPHFCTSIGLWQGDRPLLGVIGDVPGERLYSGVVGAGAWLDNQPIRVSPQRSAAQAVLATGFPVGRSFAEESLREFTARVQQFKKIRLFGSAAMSLAYVADGMVDAYAEDGINLWDIAAGAALVLAAGGSIEIGQGGSNPWSRNVRASANPELWQRS